MTLNKKISVAPFFVLAILSLNACGGGGDGGGDSANVVAISLDNSALPVGGSGIVSVKFSYSASDVFDHGHNVVIAVSLPSSVQLRLGTSEIKRPIDDRSVEDQAIFCENGKTLVHFNLDSGELTDAENPSGDADAELRFTIDAIRVDADGTIIASASENEIAVSCPADFPAQAIAAVNVF